MNDSVSHREIIQAVLEILHGVDQTETESQDGWWETSTGANFGADVLAKIRALDGKSDAP